MTCDGHIAAAAPGALVVLDRDLNVKSSGNFALAQILSFSTQSVKTGSSPA
jgi:hypothetical protein